MNKQMETIFQHYDRNGWEVTALVPTPSGDYLIVTKRPQSPFGPERVYQTSSGNEHGVSGHEYDLTFEEAMGVVVKYWASVAAS